MSALLATGSSDPTAGGPRMGVIEHDFGPILARGQTLSHEFPLINHSRRVIRLLKATALTPCCSAVGSLPKSIPPNGRAKLSIVFKPGFQTGRKQVRFFVQTDDPDRSTWWFAASAQLFGEVEAIERDDSDHVLSLNHSGRLRFGIVCRRLGEEGRDANASLSAAPPLSARFLGPARVKRLKNGLVESRRDLEVVLPAAKEPGSSGGEIALRWSDGRVLKQVVYWKSIAPLTASPSGFVLKSDEGRQTKTIVVRSVDRPFRIIGVAGSALAESPPLSRESKRSHSLKLILDPSRPTPQETADINVTTDHPDQPSLTLSVLVLPPSTSEPSP